jgi:signal transduction histidine kinase
MILPRPVTGIRARLALLILLAMTALVALLIYEGMRQHADDRRAADANLQRVATFAAHSERERFDAAQRLLTLAAQSPAFAKVAASPGAKDAFDSCTRALFVLDQLLPETSGFALWDTNGDALCSSKGAAHGEFNVRDRLWFQTAKQRQAIATGSYELAPPNSQPSLGFGMPIRDASGTRTVAYLSTGLKLDRPDDLLAKGNLPRTGAIGIVDQNGIVINSSNGQSGQPSGAGFFDRWSSLKTYPDSRVTDGLPGRRAAGVRITDADDAAVTLVIAADKDALVAPLSETLLKDLWPIVIVTGLGLLAVWLLAQRWVVRPVQSLVKASDELAAGDLAARAIVPSGTREFEKLAASFNQIAATRERASHAKDDFLGLVSHELKTPITTVLGNAEVLRRSGDRLRPEQRDEALDDIHTGAQRLAAIIDNMLALARLERGVGLDTEPLQLVRMAQAAARSSGAEAAARVAVQGDAAIMALGGETYVEQILRNLVANALKYSPRDEPVEVVVEHHDGMATVRVLDRGEGIDDAERALVFQPFYRSARTSSHAEGVGIGLSVCKSLTEAMGGTIWCLARRGGGCEFGFTLPLVPEDELEGEEPATEAPPAALVFEDARASVEPIG